MSIDNKPEKSPEEPTPIAENEKENKKKRSWRSVLRTGGIVLLIFVAFSAVSIGGAEYYTAQPDFCGSCHIMDPYYESWHSDIHGARLGVRCVDCHYAPGEQHTFKAKFKGLSQAASYFSGRAGGSRPRAHVNDASCLRSGCHGGMEHLDKILMIGDIHKETRLVSGHEVEIERKPTVRFIHAKHRNVEHRMEDTEERIKEIKGNIQTLVGSQVLEKIDAIARSVGPAVKRQAEMRRVITDLGVPSVEADAFELMRLSHMEVRLDQLAGLNCAACHTYDATGGRHFAVDQHTCFTCHFTNQSFNQDTGECLTCHEAPTRQIFVHEQPGASLTSTSDGVQASMMDHRDIVKRGIDCASCHFDVIRGEAVVTERECTHCHDQDRFLAEFEHRTTETVAEYHRVHVAGQRARCVDCHRSVEHNLINPTEVGSSSDFLRPVIDDCQHCHPNHHHEQVELLMGVGGKGMSRPMPNAMFGSRLNCRGCHSEEGSDFKGDELIKATEDTCVACHSSDYGSLFQQWLSEISSAVEEAEAGMGRIEKLIEERKAAGKSIPEDIVAMVNEAQANIHFVKSGNGVHNKAYAIRLLDMANRNLDQAVIALVNAED